MVTLSNPSWLYTLTDCSFILRGGLIQISDLISSSSSIARNQVAQSAFNSAKPATSRGSLIFLGFKNCIIGACAKKMQ